MTSETKANKGLWALTGEFFTAIHQLHQLGEARQPDPQTLHSGFRRNIDRFCTQAAVHGVDIQDIQDIQYALVALADETALSLGPAVRDYWLKQMLQVMYFRESVAGDGFFDRLEHVRRSRREVALEAYYLCLLHGFRGRYAVHGKELELHDLVEQVGSELRRYDAAGAQHLSPEGARPSESIVQARAHRGLVFYGLAALALSLAIYFGMRIDLSMRVSEFVERVQEAY